MNATQIGQRSIARHSKMIVRLGFDDCACNYAVAVKEPQMRIEREGETASGRSDTQRHALIEARYLHSRTSIGSALINSNSKRISDSRTLFFASLDKRSRFGSVAPLDSACQTRRSKETRLPFRP